VTETRAVVACTTCRTFWFAVGESAACADATHGHRTFEIHRHRDDVVLPDGTHVTAASFDPADPYARSDPPDFGVYLDARWAPPWPNRVVDWPDFGVPAEPSRFVATLRGLLERARRGERVEIGCVGGHGRTGTALACLAVLAGEPPPGAVAWVRAEYCADAVETPEQEAFVAQLRQR
jgi:hypothetical protein